MAINNGLILGQKSDENRPILNLAKALDELALWWWLGIFLCFLIIPPIILFIKYINYLARLGEMRHTSYWNSIEETKIWHLLGLVAIIAALAAIPLWPLCIILVGLGFIFFVIGGMSLDAWGTDYERQRGTPASREVAEAVSQVKWGTLLMIILVGIFWLPITLKKAGQALLKDMGMSTPSPAAAYPNAASPNAALAFAPVSNATPVPGNKFCPTCGLSLPSEAKFCGKCGNKM